MGISNARYRSDSRSLRQQIARFSGGRETFAPLQIQRVNPNSLAERFGMRDNDYILRIGPVSTEFLDHHAAQEHIKRYPVVLEMTLQR